MPATNERSRRDAASISMTTPQPSGLVRSLGLLSSVGSFILSSVMYLDIDGQREACMASWVHGEAARVCMRVVTGTDGN